MTGARFARYPGGKGANQAVAAARLGADVTMVGAVGEDTFAAEALAGLEEAGVELRLRRVGETGVALILVAADGETQIVAVPGANGSCVYDGAASAILCQLEIPNYAVRLPTAIGANKD